MKKIQAVPVGILLIFSFIFFALSLNRVHAQDISLGIWPPLLEVMIQPDKGITQAYKLYNAGETDLAIVSSLTSFAPADEVGNIELKDYPPPSWFSFQNADLKLGQKFLLPAGKNQEVVLKIKIPPAALEQDYYATLLFETIPGVIINQNSSQAQAKIGANILLTVSQDGNPAKKAFIEEFSVSLMQLIDSFTQPEFILRIKNTGKSYFKPQGKIKVTGWFGQEYELKLLPENILTNSVRQVQCQDEEKIGPCRLSANRRTKFMLGLYQAKVEFGLDDSPPAYFAQTRFFALPIKLLLGLLTILVILFIIKSKVKIGS